MYNWQDQWKLTTICILTTIGLYSTGHYVGGSIALILTLFNFYILIDNN
jgi:hypothetical protein